MTPRAAIYAGGFLGPFGGGVMIVIIPEIRADLGASTAEATAGITVYLLAFAALQLVSGTIGERLGIGRTVRAAYVVYAVASVAVALAGSLIPFLLGRVAQGLCNAFTSPLLLATLAEATPAQELGRNVGTFNAVQTAGMVSAPLIGGLAGAVDWRLAFLVPAAVALLLAVAPLPGAARARGEPTRLRAAFTPAAIWASVSAFSAYLAIAGLGVLVALRAADELGLDATERGLLLAAFGAAGVLASRPAGDLVDRFGAVSVCTAGALVSAAAVASIGLANEPLLVGAAWLVAGLGNALLWGGLNTLTVRAAPLNRAGAVSVVGAFKFAGGALTPVLLVPLYEAEPEAAFAVAAAIACTIALTVRPAQG